MDRLVSYRYGPFWQGLQNHFNDVWTSKRPKWWPNLWPGWRWLDRYIAYGVWFLMGVGFYTCFYYTGLLPAAYFGYFGCCFCNYWTCFKAIQVGVCGEKFYWTPCGNW